MQSSCVTGKAALTIHLTEYLMLQVACVGKDMSASLHCVYVTFLFPHESGHQRKKMFTQGQVNICGVFTSVMCH